MHPILASGSRLGLYLAFWSMVAILLGIAYASASSAEAVEAVVVTGPVIYFYAFVCLSAWYVCRAIPLAVASTGRILIAQLLASAVATGLWILVWEGWTYTVQPWFGQSTVNYRAQMPLVAASGVMLFWSAAMFHYLLIAFENSRSAIARNLSLEVMAREAELKALRAQIDPHFLFNSLNSISALTASDPGGARQMCILLATFFRNCVRLGNEDHVPLEQEIEMVSNYFEIEKIRCGARLTTRIEIDDEAGSCLVPPLILQPLVENAVRYGIHARLDGGNVEVIARRKGDTLELVVENPFDTEAGNGHGTGVGLENVRQRIRTLFARRGDLITSRREGVFRAELRLPCVSEEAGNSV